MTQEERIAMLEAQVMVLATALVRAMDGVDCCYGYAHVSRERKTEIKNVLTGVGLLPKKEEG